MAAAAPINTVEASLQLCGVPNAPLFGGQTPATRVAEQVFMNAFDTCRTLLDLELNFGLMRYFMQLGSTIAPTTKQSK